MRRPEHTFKGGAGVSCVTGFFSLIAILEKHYGRPKPALARGPFELILYENIAYLVSEDRREKAFRELKARIGTRPEDLLVASIEELAKITALGGIFPELRAKRLQESALLVRDDFGGDPHCADDTIRPGRHPEPGQHHGRTRRDRLLHRRR